MAGSGTTPAAPGPGAGVTAPTSTPGAKPSKTRLDRTYTANDATLLGLILVALVGITLGGLAIMLGFNQGFVATDLATVLALPVGVISAVSAGIFGYSLGTSGTTTAQQGAAEARREADSLRQEARVTAGNVGRVIKQARDGQVSKNETGDFKIGVPDMRTLYSDANRLAKVAGASPVEVDLPD